MPEFDARRVAFEVLRAVELRGAFADATLGRALAKCARAPDEDRRLAAQLTYGVLAYKLRLDHTIGAYSSRRKLDPSVAVALRMGLYQLCFLERVPPYAAVDTTLALVRTFAAHACGFVNALLRRVTRKGEAELPQEEPLKTAVRLSHPEWLVELWRSELGSEQAAALMAADNTAMPTVLRCLSERDHAIELLRSRGLRVEPARHAPDAIRCSAPSGIAGVTVVQAEASQLVALMVGASRGERILDACAAPGGKAAYLARLVGEQGSVVAVDAGRDAERRITETCKSAGVTNVTAIRSPIEAAPDLGCVDAALVDAPCSGLGTLREHPEIRWRRSPADIASLAERQRSILANTARRVRRGGRLVYATCTISHAENDAVIDEFLAGHDGFREDDAASSHPALRALLDERGRLRTFPHVHDMGGFFAARLVRIA